MASLLQVDAVTDKAASRTVPMGDVLNGTCRAWLHEEFGVLKASYNVASVTRSSTNNYLATVALTNPLPDTNYSLIGSAGGSNGQYATVTMGVDCNASMSTSQPSFAPRTVSSFQFVTYTSQWAAVTASTTNIAVFR